MIGTAKRYPGNEGEEGVNMRLMKWRLLCSISPSGILGGQIDCLRYLATGIVQARSGAECRSIYPF